jgi:isopenicillin-N N-acyltransferase-like protein
MVSNEGFIGHSQSHYQHIVVKGLPYDRGFSHGTQVTEKIRFNVDYYKRPGKLPPRLV